MLWEPCGVRWQCIWAGFLSVTQCVWLILCRIHMYNISLFHILMSFCFWKFYRLLTVVCIQKTEVHCSISRNDAVSPDTRDCVACSGSGLPGTPPSPPSQCADTFKKIIASGLEGLAHCWTAEWAMMYIAFLLQVCLSPGVCQRDVRVGSRPVLAEGLKVFVYLWPIGTGSAELDFFIPKSNNLHIGKWVFSQV